MLHLIYGLSDPGGANPKVRYVGYTRRALAKRLSAHLTTAKARKYHRHHWIMHVLESGRRPTAVVLEEVTAENWQERECWWIAHLAGNDLVNSTAGGGGLVDPSAETRAKISAANKGKRKLASIAALATLAVARRGQSLPDETRAKIAAAHAGRTFSPETLAKMSAGQTGRKHSAETRAKMSAAHAGSRHPAAVKAKIAASNSGRNFGHNRLTHGQRSALNSGRRWITDGVTDLRLAVGEALPEGWRFGRSAAVGRRPVNSTA